MPKKVHSYELDIKQMYVALPCGKSYQRYRANLARPEFGKSKQLQTDGWFYCDCGQHRWKWVVR